MNQNIFNLTNFITNPPYRTKNKIKHILKNDFNTSISDADLLFTGPMKLNNINIKKAKQEFSHKVVAPIGSYSGDILFPLQDYQRTKFLILIEINTRKAYGRWLYDKTDKTLIESFKSIEQQIAIENPNHFIRSIRFDGESGIKSKQFQNFLHKNNISFSLSEPGQHTSNSVIDRLCNTIRNIAFNMNMVLDSQEKMDLILDYYNNTPHKTLSETILKSEPKLRPIFKYGITPNEVQNIPELEEIFVRECLKHNLYLVKEKENIVGELCRIYNKVEGRDKFKKLRSKLSTEIYKVNSKKGKLYECIDLNNDKNIKLVPRFEIKLLSE